MPSAKRDAVRPLDGHLTQIASIAKDAEATILFQADDATSDLWKTIREDVANLERHYRQLLELITG
jgi:hypothetical protein